MVPNFLVIGAGRSGTTSLHHYLGAHPQVYVPAVKAPSHFACDSGHPLPAHFITDPVAYQALFDGVTGETAVGEVSPAYLATVHAAPRIAEQLPNVRLIAILRHPVDRVFARFVGRVRDGLEHHTSFAALVDEERGTPLVRDNAVGTYLAGGCVSHVLATYLARFPRQQMRFYLFEDLQRDAAGVLRGIFEFLQVDPTFVPDLSRRHNTSGGMVRNRVVRRAWVGSERWRAAVRPYVPATLRDRVFGMVTRDLVPLRLDPTLRAELTALYRDDIERLATMLDRDLSHWLS